MPALRGQVPAIAISKPTCVMAHHDMRISAQGAPVRIVTCKPREQIDQQLLAHIFSVLRWQAEFALQFDAPACRLGLQNLQFVKGQSPRRLRGGFAPLLCP